MAKQMIEIEVPDGWEVDGVFDAADYWRESDPGRDKVVRLLLRRKHVWPAWLPPGWVAVDPNGMAWWYGLKPDRCNTMWTAHPQSLLEPYIRHGALTLPPLDSDWTKNIFEVRHG